MPIPIVLSKTEEGSIQHDVIAKSHIRIRTRKNPFVVPIAIGFNPKIVEVAMIDLKFRCAALRT